MYQCERTTITIRTPTTRQGYAGDKEAEEPGRVQ